MYKEGSACSPLGKISPFIYKNIYHKIVSGSAEVI